MVIPHNPITIIGETTFRDARKLIGIAQGDRRSHLYLIGKTGTGKSTLLETMIRQDIAADHGCALLDPHGDLVERVLGLVQRTRAHDLVYLDARDTHFPLGFNPLAGIPRSARALAASGMLDAFKKIWADSWGPRTEHLLRNALVALLDQPSATLADILRLFSDRHYRQDAAGRVSVAAVREFWLREFEGYPARLRAEAIAPIQNKVGAFLANPILSGILLQPESSFDVRRLMDTGGILLVNLAKGRIGEDTASLLGALLVAHLGLAALGRADVPEPERRDFHVYLDEFQTFTTLSLGSMLSELRKYRVGLTLAHQYLAQLDLKVRDGILGNVGTLISFRVGMVDALVLERELAPEVEAVDLVKLPNHHIYLKLMIEGAVSRPFSAKTTRPFI